MLSQKGLLRVTIIFPNLIILKCSQLLNEKSHRGQIHLKMTTRARAIHIKIGQVDLAKIAFFFIFTRSGHTSYLSLASVAALV